MLKVALKQLIIVIFLAAASYFSIARGVKSELISSDNSITKVESLQDIKRSDWAYEALKNLSDRYNCWLPDRFGINGEINRYEFAFVLNRCLEVIKNLDNKDLLLEDLAIIQRLKDDLDREISIIKNRVEGLSGSTELNLRN